MGFIIASLIAAAFANGILCHQLHHGHSTQNFLTWILWAMLDGVVTITLYLQGGNFLLVGFYVVGSSVVAWFVYKAGGVSEWTWFESLIVALVIVCVIIRQLSGDYWASIAGTLAIITAGIPQLRDAYRTPEKMSFAAYVGFLFANGFSTLGGKEWSVPERFYPAMCTVYTLVFLGVIALRRRKA